MMEEVPMITVYKIEEWRNWLSKNHLKEKKVGLISHKKHTGKESLSHRQAMEEAICFGWIDTILKRIDEDTFVRYFVKRGDNANWSINTLSYAKNLLKQGRMSPQGILRYKQGLKKKPHDHGIPKNPEMPLDLKSALSKNEKSMNNFEAFTPSSKKMFHRWILGAKTDETRAKRVDYVVKKAYNNDKNFI